MAACLSTHGCLSVYSWLAACSCGGITFGRQFCCSFQPQNVFSISETSSLHWKCKLRNAWGRYKRNWGDKVRSAKQQLISASTACTTVAPLCRLKSDSVTSTCYSWLQKITKVMKGCYKVSKGFFQSLQASHDAHGTVLDGIEDRLTSHEIKSAASLVSINTSPAISAAHLKLSVNAACLAYQLLLTTTPA